MNNEQIQPKKRPPSRPVQLLLRNLDWIKGSQIGILNPGSAEVVLQLAEQLPSAAVAAFYFDFAIYEKHKIAYEQHTLNNVSATYGPWYAPAKLRDSLIVFLPKSRPLIELVLDMATTVVETGAVVYVVGEKNEGIRSARKIIEQKIGSIEQSDAARHSVIYQAPKTDAYRFSGSLESFQISYQFEFSGHELNIQSLPGVFSYDHLDKGTEFLLQTLAMPLSGKILDFGCGAGVIGTGVQIASPDSEVDFIDNNALAVRATELTLTANNLQNKVWPSDGFGQVTAHYDAIISNPPFHSGVATDYDVAGNLFKEAAQHLNPNGKLIVVANEFLPYPKILEKYFRQVDTLARDKYYKVLSATGQQKITSRRRPRSFTTEDFDE